MNKWGCIELFLKRSDTALCKRGNVNWAGFLIDRWKEAWCVKWNRKYYVNVNEMLKRL